MNSNKIYDIFTNIVLSARDGSESSLDIIQSYLEDDCVLRKGTLLGCIADFDLQITREPIIVMLLNFLNHEEMRIVDLTTLVFMNSYKALKDRMFSYLEQLPIERQKQIKNFIKFCQKESII